MLVGESDSSTAKIVLLYNYFQFASILNEKNMFNNEDDIFFHIKILNKKLNM